MDLSIYRFGLRCVKWWVLEARLQVRVSYRVSLQRLEAKVDNWVGH